MSRSAVRSFAVSALAALLLLSGLPPGTSRPAAAVSPDVVISQVYGGGGNSGATYKNDFIELFNRGAASVEMTNWSVQYASATGSTWQVTVINGTLPAGGYFLIQEAQGTGGTTPLPTPDATGNIAMSGTAGKVALRNTNTAITGTSCPTSDPTVVDFVGYGTTATCYEGAGPTATLSNTTAAIRGGNGCTDTDNNSADLTTAAPAPRNSATTPAPCGGGDAAPAVSSTDPPDNATNVAVDSNISITYNEPVDVAAGWYSISCTNSGTHEATESSGPTTYTLDPTTDFANGETCTVTIEADNVSDQDTNDPPDNMAADYSFDFTTVSADPCSGAYTPIYEIQGSGTTSPLNGTSGVTTEGVVTGDFQATDGTGLSGFFIQDPTGDANTATSDGVFVFVPSASSFSGVALSVGDEVRVTGRVAEFNTLTEIDFVSELLVCESGTTAATPVDLPETTNGELERYEGMLITIPETLTVSQNFFLGRYGQLHLSSDGRMYTPTNSNDAGSPAQQAQADLNARRQIILDDGRSGQNPNPVPYLVEGSPDTNADDTLRAGDTTVGLTGNLDFGQISSTTSIRDYRVQPTAPVEFARTNPRTSEPEDTGGNLTVASFNVLNYFTTFDQPGAECTGPDPNPRENCRGANDQAEFDRQKAKIVAAISAMDADVVGLMEMQNNGDGPDGALVDLVEALNDEDGPGTWAHIPDPDFIGDDAIKVALIYKPASVTPIGDSVSDTDPIHDRPPVAQSFSVNATAGVFTVIVNHFKSKGSCPDPGDPDYAGNFDSGDGQGCWNAKRVQQAQALLEFIDERQTTSGDDDVLVIGDLNSYGEEDPIQVLEQDLGDILGDGTGGLIDQLDLRVEGEPYSYIFDGQSGYLDHALATGTMSAQVTDATEWHINADEPSVLDYNTEFKPDDRYTATPYRSSDHDPVIVGLQVDAPPNQGPTAVAEADPTTTEVGLEVDFDGTGSSDPDGTIESYAWDFNADGVVDESGPDAVQASYRYRRAGTYEAGLTVTDDDGETASDTVTITVRAPDYDFAWVAPTVEPPARNRFVAGTVAELHFTLGDDYGLDIFKGGWPKHQRFVCGTEYKLIENSQWHTRPFGSAGLTYDTATQTYTYHWQTREEWGKPWLSCRQFQIRLRQEEPPTLHHADVKFIRETQPTN